MRLYVWHDALSDYTAGVMFAHADTVEQARELVCPGWAGDEEKVRAGYVGYMGAVHNELRGEPTVYEGAYGTAIWGGG